MTAAEDSRKESDEEGTAGTSGSESLEEHPNAEGEVKIVEEDGIELVRNDVLPGVSGKASGPRPTSPLCLEAAANAVAHAGITAADAVSPSRD